MRINTKTGACLTLHIPLLGQDLLSTEEKNKKMRSSKTCLRIPSQSSKRPSPVISSKSLYPQSQQAPTNLLQPPYIRFPKPSPISISPCPPLPYLTFIDDLLLQSFFPIPPSPSAYLYPSTPIHTHPSSPSQHPSTPPKPLAHIPSPSSALLTYHQVQVPPYQLRPPPPRAPWGTHTTRSCMSCQGPATYKTAPQGKTSPSAPARQPCSILIRYEYTHTYIYMGGREMKSWRR